MLKKISIYKRILMLLVLCTVFLLPVTRCHAEEMQYYTSGMYTYYVINEAEKEISICAISYTAKKIVIPSELDGYQVSRIGYPEGDHYEEAKKLADERHIEYEARYTKGDIINAWKSLLSLIQ